MSPRNLPLGAADTGGQVVYVLELSKKLAQLGYEVDIWTRRFEDQPEIEPVADQVRIIRGACAAEAVHPKEYLSRKMPQWSENALRFIKKHGCGTSSSTATIGTQDWADSTSARRWMCRTSIPLIPSEFGRNARWRTTTRVTRQI
jgi:hypothetical protein